MVSFRQTERMLFPPIVIPHEKEAKKQSEEGDFHTRLVVGSLGKRTRAAIRPQSHHPFYDFKQGSGTLNEAETAGGFFICAQRLARRRSAALGGGEKHSHRTPSAV